MLSFFRRNNSPEWLESRRERLQVWLQKICKIPFIVQSPLILEFLNVSLKKDIQNVHLPRLMGSVEDESVSPSVSPSSLRDFLLSSDASFFFLFGSDAWQFGISDVLYDVERGIFAIAGRPADALARLDGKISNWRLPWEDPESVVPQGNVSVWRRMTSEELKTRQGKPGSPVAAASSPPSLDGGEADSAQVWGVVDSVTFEQEVMKIAWWFSDGEGAEDSMGTLFVALNDGKMLWYTLNAAAELELRHETQLHDSAITGLFLDIGNHLLLSCGQDKKLIACRVSPKNLESGFEVVSQTTYPKAWLTSLTYAPALQFAFVGTMSGDIVVYDVSQNPAVHVHSFGGEEHSGSIQSLTIAGPPPAAAGEDPEHPEERKESLEEAAAAKKTVTSTDFRIFAGSFDGVVSCWSVPDATHLVSQIKRLVKYTSSPSRPITALAELGDRDLLFAALDNG